MKNAILITLLIVLPFCGLTSRTQRICRREQLPALYTSEEKVYAISLIWSELKYNFVHIDRAPCNPDSLYRSYIPLIMNTKNDVEFFDLLKRFIAAFNDGHTNICETPYKWKEIYDYAPLFFEEINGHFYISRLWEMSGLDSIALGAELIQIEGIPAHQYVKKHYFPYIAHGSKQAKLSIAASDYIGTGGPDSRLSGILRFKDGTQRSIHMPNNYISMKKQNRTGRMWHWKGIQKPRHAPVTLEWLKNGVAWMDFRFFDMESRPVIDTMMEQIRQHATGLIIDLRYCPGGNSPVGDHLIKYIIDADYFLCGASQTRISNGYKRSQGNWRPEFIDFYHDQAYEKMAPDTVRIDRTKVYRGPIVILVDKYTASASETFLVQIQELPNRPLIIGRQTYGSTGAPLVVDLPHNARVRICTLRHLFPISGKIFDNQGIIPDEIIMPTIDDFISGHDTALDRALEIITNMSINNINKICQFLNGASVNLRINYTNKNIDRLGLIAHDLQPQTKNKLYISLQRVWQTREKESEEQIEQLLDEQIEYFQSKNIKVDYKNNIYCQGKRCYADTIRQSVVNYNGTLFKCTARNFADHKVAVGYLNDEGIPIWNQNYYKHYLKPVFDNPKCKCCLYVPICLGVCSQKYIENGDASIEKECNPKEWEKSIQEELLNSLYNYIKQNS